MAARLRRRRGRAPSCPARPSPSAAPTWSATPGRPATSTSSTGTSASPRAVGPARRDRARHVHDGAGRAGGHRLGRRPGRGRRVRRPVHPAGAGARRRRRGDRRGHRRRSPPCSTTAGPGRPHRHRRRAEGPRPRPGRRRSSPDVACTSRPTSRSRSSPRCGSAARPAGWWWPRPRAELVDAVRAADAAGEPLLVLGGGSNLVVADEGFDGQVVQVATRGVARLRWPSTAAASRPARTGTHVVARAVAGGLAGIEALSGIPGLVGATPIQNVGAYGQERRADGRLGARAGPHDRRRRRCSTTADCRFALPAQRVQGLRPRTSCWRSRFALEPSPRSVRPVRYAELARAPRRRGRASASRRPTSGRRCSSCAAARAWCSTPATTTPGAPGRSSPTRSCPPTTPAGCSPADAPRWPEPRRPGEDLRRLADRAGRLRQGLRRRPGAGCRPSTRWP